MAQSEPKHGLYLQNSEVYLGDLTTPETVVEYAEAAESAGWDGVFLADGLGNETPTIDPWITMSAVAMRTDEVTLGTWVTPVPRRHPWQLAHNVATVDHLSDGRVMFGCGLGNPGNYTMFGGEWDPEKLGRQYDEALEIISRLWQDDPLTYEGECYKTNRAELPLTPVQTPRVPVVLGGVWPNKAPFRRATRWDGIMPGTAAMWDGGAQGEPVTGTVEEEVREMLEYYRGLTDDPGEVILPVDTPEAPPDFAETCRDLGASWLLTYSMLDEASHNRNLERIREGPPE